MYDDIRSLYILFILVRAQITDESEMEGMKQELK